MTAPKTAFQVRKGIHERAVRALRPDEVPIIDFGGFYSPSRSEQEAAARALREACMNQGYFYLRNHQFPEAVVDRAYAAMQRFFSLPVEQKMKNHYLASSNHRGYVPVKGINADHSLPGADESEAIEMAHDLPADDPDLLKGVRFYGPNNWPEQPPDFRWALGTYFDCQLELGRKICRAFELALDLEEGFFTSRYTKPLSRLRVCYYPPQREDFDLNNIGIGAHTDYECFTTVWQNGVPGLQMLTAEGEWQLLPPIPGTFAVNLGDLMQLWTNDMFRSTAHRVINLSGVERYSLVQFFGLNHDAAVEGPLPGCAGPGNAWRYKPTTVGAHVEEMVAKTYHYAE